MSLPLRRDDLVASGGGLRRWLDDLAQRSVVYDLTHGRAPFAAQVEVGRPSAAADATAMAPVRPVALPAPVRTVGPAAGPSLPAESWTDRALRVAMGAGRMVDDALRNPNRALIDYSPLGAVKASAEGLASGNPLPLLASMIPVGRGSLASAAADRDIRRMASRNLRDIAPEINWRLSGHNSTILNDFVRAGVPRAGNAMQALQWAAYDRAGSRLGHGTGRGVEPSAAQLAAWDAAARDVAPQVAARLDAIPPGDLFIRWGDLPRGERSRNHATGQLEQGTSVYGARYDPFRDRLVYDEDGTDAGAALQYLMAGGQPFAVTGRVVGRGSDGEPLLRDVRKIGPLTYDAGGFPLDESLLQRMRTLMPPGR